MEYLDIVKEQLKVHEGFVGVPYKDTMGKTTIGYGRNLEAKPLKEEEAEHLLMNDINDAVYDAKALFPTFDFLDEQRKAVLVNMAFNLGRNRLGMFRKFIRAVNESDWENASYEMLNSRWAEQVGRRATELAKIMKG